MEEDCIRKEHRWKEVEQARKKSSRDGLTAARAYSMKQWMINKRTNPTLIIHPLHPSRASWLYKKI